MNIDTIKLFCDLEERSWYNLREPFVFGDYVCACDSHCIVRVPNTFGITRPCPLPDPALLDGFFDMDHAGEWVDIPPLPEAPTEKCETCRGTGKIAICEECEGEGQVDYIGKTGSWAITCPCCKGDGIFAGMASNDHNEACESCNGTGIRPEDYSANIKIGTVRVDVRLLRKISILPDVKLLAPAQPGATRVVFTFVAGVGTVMGLNPQEQNQ